MTILPEAGSNTTGSRSARCRRPMTGSYAGNISSGFRHGPSRSMMLVMVTSPTVSVFILSPSVSCRCDGRLRLDATLHPKAIPVNHGLSRRTAQRCAGLWLEVVAGMRQRARSAGSRPGDDQEFEARVIWRGIDRVGHGAACIRSPIPLAPDLTE